MFDNEKILLLAIERFAALKKVATSDAFYLFYDAIFTGDFDKFKRYGLHVKDGAYDDKLSWLIFKVNSEYKAR